MAHVSGHSEAQAQSSPPAQTSRHRVLLNTDGQPHPMQNTLVALTFLLGALALAACSFRSLHLLASWAGLAGVLTAVVAQYVSVTTAERFVIVIAGGAAAIGLGIGLAHGGLY